MDKQFAEIKAENITTSGNLQYAQLQELNIFLADERDPKKINDLLKQLAICSQEQNAGHKAHASTHINAQ